MKMRFHAIVFCCLAFYTASFSQSPDNPVNPNNQDPAKFIAQIYADVSGDSLEAIDWDKVRSHFVEEAVIVLKTSREGKTRFTVDGFLDDFKRFYLTPDVKEHGFRENVVKMESKQYHDMAQVWVVYEARIPGIMKKPQLGLDFWLLENTDQGWKVLSVNNEVILPGESIPENLVRASY